MLPALNSFPPPLSLTPQTTPGSNDAANAWGTSVGSGAISIRFACWAGGLLEFLGAVCLGGGVSSTIKNGVTSITAPACWACGFCDSKMALYMTGEYAKYNSGQRAGTEPHPART